VDEVIAAQARKVDALKTHKKGLMQQLFPREGETQPRLRFPEFQNAGEWVNTPLGDLGDIITGKTPSTRESELWGGDILFITPTDISEDDKYQNTTARTVVETKSTKVLPEGSVVYTCIASIGKMALTVCPSITNQQINAVVPNKKALGEFIYYALANVTPWIKTIPASNTLPIINKTDFSRIAILHPADKDEQHRIASCLSSLDALIAAETRKHAALQRHKRGLMQQLFPASEELAP
jgi:type I restriction enzyme S subunit